MKSRLQSLREKHSPLFQKEERSFLCFSWQSSAEFLFSGVLDCIQKGVNLLVFFQNPLDAFFRNDSPSGRRPDNNVKPRLRGTQCHVRRGNDKNKFQRCKRVTK